MSLYSIKDTVSGVFGQVFLLKNDELAKRDFMLLKGKTPYFGDLSLYKVGLFNEETGVVNIDETFPIFIMNGIKDGDSNA